MFHTYQTSKHWRVASGTVGKRQQSMVHLLPVSQKMGLGFCGVLGWASETVYS